MNTDFLVAGSRAARGALTAISPSPAQVAPDIKPQSGVETELVALMMVATCTFPHLLICEGG